MKKIIALLLVIVLGVSLVACGGAEEKKSPDKQPAIDKFNETSANFNGVSARMNENIEIFDEATVDAMIEYAGILNEYSELLSSDQEIAQEDLDAMIEWFEAVDAWIVDVNAELDTIL